MVVWPRNAKWNNKTCQKQFIAEINNWSIISQFLSLVLACVAAGPRTCLNHLCSPSANQCTKGRVRDGWAQWQVKIHRRELAGIVYSKQWKNSPSFKALFWTKKCFEMIPSRPEFACKFVDWFSNVFQSLQMHYRVFCNLADSSRVKTNREIITIKRYYTHVAVQVQAFRWKPKKLRLFSCNKKA